VAAWLTWCQRARLACPVLPATIERRHEPADVTRAITRTALERALSRRDVPLREKTLWRMLFETAARASEVLALNIEDLDLDARRAPIRSKGGDTEWIYWGSGTAHLLPRLLRGRNSGPCPFRHDAPPRHADPAPATCARRPAAPGSATTAPACCSPPTPDGTCIN
jgi:integrase